MTTYVLVHGAWHGAWCWDRLADELGALGAEVLALDLPCEDPAGTFGSYADTVVRSMEAVSDDVVLVGHSLAGLTIPLVAARRPIRHLVFLCALVAEPGRNLVQQLQAEPDILLHDLAVGTEVDEQGRRCWVDRSVARDILFGDCSEDDARQAFELLRPQATAPYLEECPLDALPDVPRSYIVCDGDRLVNPDWSRRVAHSRLGVEAIELPGSHSPFLSRPAHLASVLQECVGGR